jgi:undecaprenyl-diphosphatase
MKSATPNRQVPGTAVDLHRSPPITLHKIRETGPWLVPAAITLALALGAAAAIDGGRLLVWDRAITDTFVGLRGAGVNRVALWVSRLGSTPVVLAGGIAGVALAARRCRSVAAVMFLTVATRPLFEWLLKALVARPRPSGHQLVPGTGYAYPSGHVLAAAATWGFVPLIAGLYLKRRWVWWTLTTLAWTIIWLVAWSRVWLGVHWTSDIIGGLAIAFVALSAAENTIERHHNSGKATACPASPTDRSSANAPSKPTSATSSRSWTSPTAKTATAASSPSSPTSTAHTTPEAATGREPGRIARAPCAGVRPAVGPYVERLPHGIGARAPRVAAS